MAFKVTVIVEPAAAAAAAASRACVICGGWLAYSNTFPTCGQCYRAGLAAHQQQQHHKDKTETPAAEDEVLPVPPVPEDETPKEDEKPK